MPAEVAHQANIGLALRLLRDHLLPTIEEWLAGEYPGVEPLEAARNFVDGQIQAPRSSSEQDAGRKGREAIPIRPRELEDPRFLLTLLDLAASTGLGRKLSVGRSSAAVRSLMRTRDAWAHFKPLSWETVYTAFTDVIAVLESARATSGRDEAIGLRDELVAHKALYEGGGVPLLRAVDRDEWRQRAELSVAEVAATAAALHTAKQRLAEREQMLRDARQRQEAAESEATDARLRESEARRIATRAEARAGKLEEGLRQVAVVTERLQGGRRSQSTGDTGQPRATGLKRSAAASPPGTAGTQRPGRSPRIEAGRPANTCAAEANARARSIQGRGRSGVAGVQLPTVQEQAS